MLMFFVFVFRVQVVGFFLFIIILFLLFYFVFWWWNSVDYVLVWLTVLSLSMAESPLFKRMSNVKKGLSKEGAVKVTVNARYLMMAERPKYVVVYT
jgi:hypothetical protein